MPERPKNYVDLDDSDEADVKRNVFPGPHLLEQAQYSQLQSPQGILVLTILDTKSFHVIAFVCSFLPENSRVSRDCGV